MPPDAKAKTAKLDDLAIKSPPRKTTLSWNVAVDYRLDQLVARASGTEPERSDLIAALVALAPTDGEALDSLVLNWRRKKVRDVVIGAPKTAKELPLPAHGPGRRAKATRKSG
jgi:hypothetical protein